MPIVIIWVDSLSSHLGVSKENVESDNNFGFLMLDVVFFVFLYHDFRVVYILHYKIYS